MIDFSKRVADSLISIGVVQSEDRGLYEYGIRQGIVLILNVLTIVLIGSVLGMVWQSIFFMLAIIPIRPYAGGYHASSRLACYLLSIPVTVGVLMGIKLIPWSGLVYFSALFCSALVILLLAPIEDSNKPLDELEKKVYKKRARINLLVLLFTAILFWIIDFRQVSIGILMALGVVAILLILGAIKNSKYAIGKV